MVCGFPQYQTGLIRLNKVGVPGHYAQRKAMPARYTTWNCPGKQRHPIGPAIFLIGHFLHPAVLDVARRIHPAVIYLNRKKKMAVPAKLHLCGDLQLCAYLELRFLDIQRRNIRAVIYPDIHVFYRNVRPGLFDAGFPY